jgi:hypothetical protein
MSAETAVLVLIVVAVALAMFLPRRGGSFT